MRRERKLQKKRRRREERDRKQRAYRNRPRTCGGCRACCFVFPLGSKPRRTWCQHVTTTGCGCYAERPDVCREYACGWIRSNLPENTRPDRSGMLVTYRRPYKGLPVVVVSEVQPHAAESLEGRSLLETLKANGIIVFVAVYDGSQIGVHCRHVGCGPDEGPELLAWIKEDGQRIFKATASDRV